MFDRFTDRARKVMALARKEAGRFNHDFIGTEHMLLGLIQEGSGVAANVLKNLGVEIKKVRSEIEKNVQTGPSRVTITMGQLPFTPRAKKVLELSMEEANELGHSYIGTEHLLLGLLRENDGVAAQVLLDLGLKLEEVRNEVLDLLGAEGSLPEALLPDIQPLMDLARQEAKRFFAGAVGTRHLALAFFREEDGIATRALRRLGIDRGKVEGDLERGLEPGPWAPAPVPLPFSQRAAGVLERALKEAWDLDTQPSSAEVFLVLLDDKGALRDALRHLDVNLDELRRCVYQELGLPPERIEELLEARKRARTGFLGRLLRRLFGDVTG